MFYKYGKKISLIFSVIMILVLTIIDQLSKVFAINNLKDQQDIIIIKNVLHLHYLENTGAAFSILSGKMPVFFILTPILVLGLIYFLFIMPENKRFLAFDYIIVFTIAGAIGNYIDRIRFNYVVDFIYFVPINFPVFNVADIYVTCSVIILIILIMVYYKEADFDLIKSNMKLKKG